MTQVFIALGSNLGNKHENLRMAREMISHIATIEMESMVIESAPQYITDQPTFVNQVIAVKTPLDPQGLLSKLKDIERQMGRVETLRYGPRIIDLDIVFYGDLVMDQKGLSIPHPLLAERSFVLGPLAEIAPHFICPRSGKSVSDLRLELSA